jgi:hypothetical protein
VRGQVHGLFRPFVSHRIQSVHGFVAGLAGQHAVGL